MSKPVTGWALAGSYYVLNKTGLLERCKKMFYPIINQVFFLELLNKTQNFNTTKWLGQPILQNVLDLWVIQETLWELRPDLLIECGTNRGGSAWYYAHLFDLMGHGRIITMDIERLHNLSHPRIEFLIGSSVSNEIVSYVGKAVSSVQGHVMVILDSDHSTSHVSKELERYAPLVTPRSYVLVQDGMIDVLPLLKGALPSGPLPAIRDFLKRHPEFEVDADRNERFVISHHPEGWLRK